MIASLAVHVAEAERHFARDPTHFILPIDDSLESIFDSLRQAGGGVAEWSMAARQSPVLFLWTSRLNGLL